MLIIFIVKKMEMKKLKILVVVIIFMENGINIVM